MTIEPTAEGKPDGRTSLEPPKLMYPHDVPAAEPPVGTVAAFYASFLGGGAMGGNLFLRTEDGWSQYARGHRAVTSTWADLTDLDTMNAAITARNPDSTARFGAVQVVVVAGPPCHHREGEST